MDCRKQMAERQKVLHERKLFVAVRTHEVPRLAADQRGEIVSICQDCWRIVLDFGFMPLRAASRLARQPTRYPCFLRAVAGADYVC